VPSEQYVELCWPTSPITGTGVAVCGSTGLPGTSPAGQGTGTVSVGVQGEATRLPQQQHRVSPIAEKSLVNYGPVRHVYARPFCIVYGTPNNQAVRLALRDLAIYIGNAHSTAHNTNVRVLSDLEYRASRQALRTDLENVVFVGGPSVNKVMAAVCKERGSSSNSSSGAVKGAAAAAAGSAMPLVCELPHTVRLPAAAATTPTPSSSSSSSNAEFAVDGAVFSGADDAVVFTLPLYRPGALDKQTKQGKQDSEASTLPEQVIMGVCIHANSAQGYQHISRLAWPVVPPMVRAPFALYLPDYLVTDGAVWEKGMGGVKKAGYWDSEWKPDTSFAYTNVL
jgi:hypothetical protein